MGISQRGASRAEATRPLDEAELPAAEHSWTGLRPGDRIEGHLRIVDELGSGGMGTVYLAQDERLERLVAIKLVNPVRARDSRVVERFLEEARVMARVRHANVVAIHGMGQTRGQPYFAMEYVPGTTLATWLRMRGRLSPKAAVRVLASLCDGVQAIHDAGALHRDLKPGNVLVGPHQRIAVADFGLAREVAASESPAFAMSGTPAYVAPELARGESLSPGTACRVDVYALGVIAFEMLTGVRPFEDDDANALLTQHGHAPVPIPSEGGRVHAAFDAPLLAALAKSPDERTPRADLFREQLQCALRASQRRPADLRILLVDDDLDTLTATRALLLLAWPRAEIVVMNDPVAALGLACRAAPDIVVTDLHMPSGGGEGLAAGLRGNPATATLPIVVATGYGGHEDWERLRAIGVDRFLVKPVDIDALVAMIATLTGRRPS